MYKLTGLPSRLLLHDLIELEIAHAKRISGKLTLLHLDPFPISDIDHVFGYKVGDDVLKQAAVRIQKSIRESDTLVRMDADEFAVLMPTVGDDEVSIVLNRIATLLETPIELEKVSISIGVMVGIASYPQHCSGSEEMMRGALIAVKNAKKQQTQFVHYDGSKDQIKVGINISTRDLLDKSFTAFLKSTFDLYQIPQEMAVIEVTETSIMTHAELAIERLGELREMGFGIAIDDFGTGYSSLAYLRLLPATELKIDKQFVTGMLDDPRDSKLVKAVISLAHEFDMHVVAEGVEIQEEANLLRRLGCEMIQGYLYSKPVQADVLEGLLSSGSCLVSYQPLRVHARRDHHRDA